MCINVIKLPGVKMMLMTAMMMLPVVGYAEDGGASQDGQDLGDWKQAVSNLQQELQQSQDNASSNLDKASKNLTDQIEKVQTNLLGQIQKLADQIQQVQQNLNDLTEKVSKS